MRETKYGRAWEALFRELEKVPNDRSTLRVNVLLGQVPLSDRQRDNLNAALAEYHDVRVAVHCGEFLVVGAEVGVVYTSYRDAVLYLASGRA